MQLEGAAIARAVRDRGRHQGIEQPDRPQMIPIIEGDQPHLNVTTRRAHHVLAPRRLNATTSTKQGHPHQEGDVTQ